MRKTLQVITLLSVVGLIGACGEKAPAPTPPTPSTDSGRAETAPIRNMDNAGVDGTGIANKVDSALDANDAAKANMDKALEAQGQ
ncbi:MAG: hypothetical protein U1F34_05180 [Gammaproteobacteria bacterium]